MNFYSSMKMKTNEKGKNYSTFDGLMFCCNEFGQIVNFMFTNSLSHKEVQPFLQKVKIQCPETVIIATDNCCSDRQSFEIGWGSPVRVVLDIFHALQRVTRTVKKDSFADADKRQIFFRNLRLLFRKKDDHGEKPLQATASESEIRLNISHLMEQFDDVLPYV